MKEPLIGKSLEELRQVSAALGMPKFKAGQMAKWLYDKRVDSIDAMSDLSKPERTRLADHYDIGREAPLERKESADGTVKYLFRGAGGRNVEAVYIPDGERATLCVSSQAGCKMRCRFCATGEGGWQGSLSRAQILNQVLSIPESGSLTNIVFMGMGEPLDNVDEVLGAIDVLTSVWGLAWSPKRITVSTVGASLQALRRLLDETHVHVALSLHNPFPGARAELMPAERILPVNAVLDLLRNYDFSHQRRLSIEYILWKMVNDDMRHATALARLLKGLDCRVNLIRFHPWGGFEGQPSSQQTMEAFRDALNARGITATIRQSRGEDIQAACGQLAGRKQ